MLQLRKSGLFGIYICRIALAEQEARTEFLRRKAKHRQIEESADHQQLAGTSQNSIVPSQQPFGHINFFKDEEEGKKHGTNEEYQAEKKAEKEKYEKDIGLLTYLGQGAVESQQSKPWYFKVPDRTRKLDEESSQKSKKTGREEFDQKRKYDLDPMRQMTKYMEIKEKHKDKGKKEKKHKHDRKNREDRGKEKNLSGKKTIEQLRADRLKREKEERKRAEEVIAKAKGDYVPVKEKEVIVDERQRSYNSQFNPDFVRKPRPKPYY